MNFISLKCSILIPGAPRGTNSSSDASIMFLLTFINNIRTQSQFLCGCGAWLQMLYSFGDLFTLHFSSSLTYPTKCLV